MSFDGPAAKGILSVKCCDILSSIIAILVPISMIILDLVFEDDNASTSDLLKTAWVVESIAGIFIVMIVFFYQQSKHREI